MSQPSNPAELVAQWRSGVDIESPAGPVFAQFAAADIVCETGGISGHCGTVCTGSRTLWCC